MSKEAFKDFVRLNPSLATFVNNNSMTWQKFYDMFELYGASNSVWDEFLNVRTKVGINSFENSFKELVNTIRGIDLQKVQKGIDNIQKTISLVQDFGTNSNSNNVYERREPFKRFDDWWEVIFLLK